MRTRPLHVVLEACRTGLRAAHPPGLPVFPQLEEVDEQPARLRSLVGDFDGESPAARQLEAVAHRRRPFGWQVTFLGERRAGKQRLSHRQRRRGQPVPPQRNAVKAELGQGRGVALMRWSIPQRRAQRLGYATGVQGHDHHDRRDRRCDRPGNSRHLSPSCTMLLTRRYWTVPGTSLMRMAATTIDSRPGDAAMKNALCVLTLVGVLLAGPHPRASSQQKDFGVPAQPKEFGVPAKDGVVVTASDIASDVGAAILARGGTAVDAAVATAFAMAVTFPTAGNIGGGGFMIVRTADGAATTFDYREKAPGKATPTMYLNAKGEINRDLTAAGYLAPGVPGTVRGMAL